MRAEGPRGAGVSAPSGDDEPTGTPWTGLAALLVLSAAAAAGCTEDPLTGPGPEEGEEPGAETVELMIRPSQMARWRDTTFSGFAVPSDARFLSMIDEQDLQSRVLLRYLVPDSVQVDSDTLAIEAYRNGRIRLLLDDDRTTFAEDGVAVRLFALGRRFTAAEATWQQAAEGEPWSSPGGDFDREVGRLELTQPADSAVGDTLDVPLGSVTDSLLTAWSDSDGQPGLAGVVEGQGTRLRMTEAILAFDVKPVDRDTLVSAAIANLANDLPSTFIFDPPVPAAGRPLRVGGFPASRFYVSFRPPNEVDGTSLPGGTVNRAELVFVPAPAPSAPFALGRPADAATVELLADPFELGPRTPIGGVRQTTTLRPDSLAAGQELRFRFTDILSRWASNPDSAGNLRLGVMLRPDAQSMEFWEFGSEASEQELQPFLRVVLTPSSGFDVP